MGTKRPFTKFESGSAAGRNGGRDGSGPGAEGRPWKKSRPSPGPASSAQSRTNTNNAHDGATGWAKKRIRAIERQLKHTSASSLPANVRIDLERELASLRSRVDTAVAKKQKNKMVSKYHMVRFFERQKATRLLRQLRKQLESASSPDEKPRLAKEIHITEVDIAYTTYFPYLEPYISLYSNAACTSSAPSATDQPNPGPSNDDKQPAGSAPSSASAKAALYSQRPEMWHAIEEALGQGQSALERLRDRRDGLAPVSRPPGPVAKPEPPAEVHGIAGISKQTDNDGASDDDGDGFFEE